MGASEGKGKRNARRIRRALVLSCTAFVCAGLIAAGIGLSGHGAAPDLGGSPGTPPAISGGPAASSTSPDGTPDVTDATEDAAANGGGSSPYPIIPSVEDIPVEAIDPIPAEHDPQTVLVRVDPDTPMENLNAALAQADGVQPTQVSGDDIKLGFVELRLAEGVEPAQALVQLQWVPGIEDAQPNFRYRLAQDAPDNALEGATTLNAPTRTGTNAAGDGAGDPAVTTIGGGPDEGAGDTSPAAVNDPRASEQWMLESIEAYGAWGIAKADKQVTVAVVDNGCLIDHEDLKGNVVDAYNAVLGNGDVTPTDGHGTHVCGIVAAQADNATGVAGVSYNAGLLPIKVFDGQYAYTSAVIDAYDYILEKKDDYAIRVVNMSLGSASETGPSSEQDDAIVQAVERAYDAGVLTVCSSGNDAGKRGGAYYNYPSDWLDCALGVIALEQDGTGEAPARAGYSNYNVAGSATKDIAAPGTSVLSTYADSTSSYVYQEGTSMAAPCVAGVAALVFAANPGLAPAEVSDIICSTATDLGPSGWDAEYGHGEVNARRAVEQARAGAASKGAPTDLGTADVRVSPLASATYCGKAIEPKPTVKVGAATLAEGADYTLSYRGNVNAGTATVTITGKGGYSGSKEATFKIAKRKVVLTSKSASKAYDGKALSSPAVTVSGDGFVAGEVSKLRATGSITNVGSAANAIAFDAGSSYRPANYTIVKKQGTLKVTARPISAATVSSIAAKGYTGKAVAPSPAVKWGGKALKRGTDYTLSYRGNVNAGTATITITGKGNFSGSVKKSFKITKAANPMAVKAAAKTVKLSNVKKKAQVVAPLAVSKAQGKVTYAKASGAKCLAVNKSTGKVTVQKGTKKGTYTAKVKVTAAGNANYKAASKTVTVKVVVK